MTLTTQGLLCILRVFSSNKAKRHEKASGHCTGAFVCPSLLWVGAAPQGNLKEWAASLLLKEEEELTSPANFLSLSFMGLGVYFTGFAGALWPSPVTVSFSSGVRGVDVAQSPPALSLQEVASSTLWCNFSTSSNNVHWYLQNPGSRLTHLFSVPSGTKQKGRLIATTVPAERRSSLHISSSQTTDSGTYFCASQHGAPQAPAASTRTLPGLSPSSSLSHTIRPHRAFAVLIFLTYTGTVLTTDTFWPYRLRTLVFIFPSEHVSPSALETSNWELAE